jgi:hypothetical protein
VSAGGFLCILPRMLSPDCSIQVTLLRYLFSGSGHELLPRLRARGAQRGPGYSRAAMPCNLRSGRRSGSCKTSISSKFPEEAGTLTLPRAVYFYALCEQFDNLPLDSFPLFAISLLRGLFLRGGVAAQHGCCVPGPSPGGGASFSSPEEDSHAVKLRFSNSAVDSCRSQLDLLNRPWRSRESS